MHLHYITNVQITTIPSKLSHLTEKMARTSRSNLDDGSRSVISRSERYQVLEKKRSIAATPPRIVTKVIRDKKLATTTNDDVTSLLSTASLATSPAIPQMECAQMKELLEPTLENNDEDDDSNDDDDGGGMCGGEFNEVAAMVAKSMNDDDDYSNDDGNDGSGGSGKCNNNNYANDDNGGSSTAPFIVGKISRRSLEVGKGIHH